jgi:hypothetical protein
MTSTVKSSSSLADDTFHWTVNVSGAFASSLTTTECGPVLQLSLLSLPRAEARTEKPTSRLEERRELSAASCHSCRSCRLPEGSDDGNAFRSLRVESRDKKCLESNQFAVPSVRLSSCIVLVQERIALSSSRQGWSYIWPSLTDARHRCTIVNVDCGYQSLQACLDRLRHRCWCTRWLATAISTSTCFR